MSRAAIVPSSTPNYVHKKDDMTLVIITSISVRSARQPARAARRRCAGGAIILGIGGDNSKSAGGTFYEGAMTSGYPHDATENSLQANIAAAY